MRSFIFAWFVILGSIAGAQTLSSERIVFRTNVGDIVVALYPKQAPVTVEQVLKLARLGVFDGVKVFRVEPGFVAQTENYDTRAVPLTDEQQAAVVKLPLEVNTVHHRRRILSMARYDDPNSAETSFSFVLGEAAHLDGQYTAFGEIVSGLDVLTEIERYPTAPTTTNDTGSATKIVSAVASGSAAAAAAAKPRTIEILHTDVIDASGLSQANLARAHAWTAPDELERNIFLVFAVCAFSFTILKPMIETLREKKKP